ncbi:hypothetical protein ACFL35_19580 [Candidatus Riflebacteria bacterium]
MWQQNLNYLSGSQFLSLYFSFAGQLSYAFYMNHEDIPIFRYLEYGILYILIIVEIVFARFFYKEED